MASKGRVKREQGLMLDAARQKAAGTCAACFFVVLTALFPLYLNPEKYVKRFSGA